MSIPTVKDCPNCKWNDPEHCCHCLTAEANDSDAPSEWEPSELYTETDPRCTECEAGYTARIAALESDLVFARDELNLLKAQYAELATLATGEKVEA